MGVKMSINSTTLAAVPGNLTNKSSFFIKRTPYIVGRGIIIGTFAVK